MKRYALAVLALLATSSAHAENLVIGCPLLAKYSDSDVSYLLQHARSVLSEQEVGRIYAKYVSLKGACQTDAHASRVVPVSATLRSWLAQNGVDLARIGRAL
jgi:hypothetical protein